MFDDDLFLEEALEAEVLLAGGGGSGGGAITSSTGRGGSGGAGRLFHDVVRLGVGAYAITIGLGGAARAAGANSGLDGGASSAFGITMPGGGGGGTPTTAGRPGGSGGGGGSTDAGTTPGGAVVVGSGAPGLGTAGNGGGVGSGGAGGGAIGVGAGSGHTSAITGTSVAYCEGGQINFSGTTPGTGGRGGIAGASTAGQNGILVVSYVGPPRATGGTITTVGGRTVHTFTANGTFTVLG